MNRRRKMKESELGLEPRQSRGLPVQGRRQSHSEGKPNVLIGSNKFYPKKRSLKLLVEADDGRKSIEEWSNRAQAYYYKSKDPNYYNEYFHRTKRDMQCDFAAGKQ